MNSLPIYSHENDIFEALLTNQVVIVEGETGSGKSTGLPQMANSRGMSCVITQPRRFAARNVSTRVAYEMGVELGTKVGYRTGFERVDSKETEVHFCTDGIEVFRQLLSDVRPDLCIYDEAHEMNINQEVLFSLAKERIAQDPDFRLIISSATPNLDELLNYFVGAKVIHVEGRTFPVVEKKHRLESLEHEVKALVKTGRNVLVFQPGKADIANTIQTLIDMGVNAEILPLHGQLSVEEQDRVFQHYNKPKVVVSTNVAQSSVTVDDIDAVVDSGIERRVEIVDGMQGLYLRAISMACRKQRKGRGGRTRKGIYVNCYRGEEVPLPFPKPEIQRLRLDYLVLILAKHGIDATKVEFLHKPPRLSLLAAKKSLFVMGATDDTGRLTDIGEKMAMIPVDVRYARMIVEADRLHVLDDILTIAALHEVNGIIEHNRDVWRRLTNEESCDLLAQLDVFNESYRMRSDAVRTKNGIHVKSFYRALQIRAKLSDVLITQSKRNGGWVDFNTSSDRKDLIRSIVVGMIGQMFAVKGGKCKDGSSSHREVDRESVVCGKDGNFIVGGYGNLIVGEPIDIEVNVRAGGTKVLHLVNMVTRIRSEDLLDYAPHLITSQLVDVEFDKSQKTLTFVYKQIFNGTHFETVAYEYPWDQSVDGKPRGFSSAESKKMIGRRIFDHAVESDDVLTSIELGRKLPDSLPPVRVYGHHPITHEDLIAYPAIVHHRTARSWYKLEWHFKQKEAAYADVSGLVPGSRPRGEFVGDYAQLHRG